MENAIGCLSLVLVDDNVSIEIKKEWWQNGTTARGKFDKARDRYLKLDNECLATQEGILQDRLEVEDELTRVHSKIVR